MTITKTTLPSSSPWMSDMAWAAREEYNAVGSSLFATEAERSIWIYDENFICYWITPSHYASFFENGAFDSIRNDPRFIALSDRVKVLIQTRPKEA